MQQTCLLQLRLGGFQFVTKTELHTFAIYVFRVELVVALT